MDFKIDDFPYLYNSDYFDIAWSHQRKGFFTTADGTKYNYKYPENWRSYNNALEIDNSEINVMPNDLFYNLSLCKVDKPWFGRNSKNISQEVISDLLDSQLLERHQGIDVCDAPIITNSIFIYDNQSGFYKRVILEINGQFNYLNSSIHAQMLIEKFGVYCSLHWR